MAKSRQALSLWRGRAGGIVYSTLNGQQVMRSAPSQVKNPKTDAQIAQRMKLAPAAHFFRTLEGMVYKGFASHTFQGRKYGNENRLRFMQLAMLNNQGPYVPKDTLKFVPFDYQISEGSLPSMTPRVHVVDNNTLPAGAIEIDSALLFTEDNVQQWADFLGVNVGDQISFLGFFANGDAYVAEAARIRVVAGEALDLGEYSITIYSATDAELANQPYGAALFLFDESAGAVVVSRQQENGQYLRSTEFVVISDDIREQYYSPAALDAAIRSYGDSQDINTAGSDYYNNLGDRAFDGTIYLSTMKFRDSAGNQKSAPVFWGKASNGNKVIFTSNGQADGALITLTEGGNGYKLLTAQVGNTNVYSEVKVGDLVTSVQWAGVESWGIDDNVPSSQFYLQWVSGQKAQRPIVIAPTGDAEDSGEGTANPT